MNLTTKERLEARRRDNKALHCIQAKIPRWEAEVNERYAAIQKELQAEIQRRLR